MTLQGRNVLLEGLFSTHRENTWALTAMNMNMNGLDIRRRFLVLMG